jgi:hypothetical protein
MSAACQKPVSWADLVAYWTHDSEALPQAELLTLEDHLMGCARCSAESERVAQLTEAFRGLLPPVLEPEQVAELRSQGLTIVDNPMAPGESREVMFPHEVDIVLHRLGGLDLSRATRVSFVLSVVGTEQVMIELPQVPFDRERGEILLACQKHFADFPPDNVAEVRVQKDDGGTQQASYTILHRFPA